MTRLVLVLMALAAVVALPASTTPQGTHAQGCTEPFEGLSLEKPETPHLPLPVVVHYMVKTGSEHDVSEKLKPRTLERIFRDGGRLTSIWGHAEIRPYLQRVERCAFSFSAFDIPSNPGEDLPNPDDGGPGQKMFYTINRHYNARDVAGVDLYIWWGIQGSGGYADFHRDSGPRRPGGVWIDKDCVGSQNCDLLLAHEIGHFLGLCHACTIASPSRVRCTRCLPSTMKGSDGKFTLARCHVRSPRLMRDDNLLNREPYTVTERGDELSTCERTLAKEFAERRVGNR
jgi:hypothetical protein